MGRGNLGKRQRESWTENAVECLADGTRKNKAVTIQEIKRRRCEVDSKIMAITPQNQFGHCEGNYLVSSESRPTIVREVRAIGQTKLQATSANAESILPTPTINYLIKWKDFVR